MSFMLEVYYPAPTDHERESRIRAAAGRYAGELTFREESSGWPSTSICLTYEFSDCESAENAAILLRGNGEHVEGPSDYGDAP